MPSALLLTYITIGKYYGFLIYVIVATLPVRQIGHLNFSRALRERAPKGLS
jgi:predicted kinase